MRVASAGAWAAAVLVAAALCASASATELGGGGEEPDPDEDESDSAPFTVVVEHTAAPRCAGSLVSLRTVVTSAACVRRAGLRGRMWAVSAPALAAGAGAAREARRRVVRVAEGRGASSLDMALLEIESPFPLQAEARPIMMATEPAECATPGLVCHAVRVQYRGGAGAGAGAGAGEGEELPPRLRITDPELVQNEKGCSYSDRALCLTGPLMCATDVGTGVVCGGKLCGALVSSSRRGESEVEPRGRGRGEAGGGDECGEVHRATRLPRFRRFLQCAQTLRDCGRGDCIDVCSQRRLPANEQEERDMNENIKTLRHSPTMPVLNALEPLERVAETPPDPGVKELPLEVSPEPMPEPVQETEPVPDPLLRMGPLQTEPELDTESTETTEMVTRPHRMRFSPTVASVARSTHSPRPAPPSSRVPPPPPLTRHSPPAVRVALTRAKARVVSATARSSHAPHAPHTSHAPHASHAPHTTEGTETTPTLPPHVHEIALPDHEEMSMYDSNAAGLNDNDTSSTMSQPPAVSPTTSATVPASSESAAEGEGTETSSTEEVRTEGEARPEGERSGQDETPLSGSREGEGADLGAGLGAGLGGVGAGGTTLSPEQEAALIVRSFDLIHPDGRRKPNPKNTSPHTHCYNSIVMLLCLPLFL